MISNLIDVEFVGSEIDDSTMSDEKIVLTKNTNVISKADWMN